MSDKEINILSKGKLLEALDEEIYVYDSAETTKFDEGVLYLANKLKATINLHVFDDSSQSTLIDQQAKEIEKLKWDRSKLLGYIFKWKDITSFKYYKRKFDQVIKEFEGDEQK